MIGESIAHYSITGKIGAGGMGEVWRARDAKLGRDVALKLLPEIFLADAQRMARFHREAQVLASLNHPNIAAIYGVEESSGRRALVLELVEGEDLSQRLKSSSIPLEEALEVARQIAEALEAAHEKGVVHRDLKPANVKLTTDGKVKVLDFGLAKALEGDPASTSGDPSQSLSPTLTVAATRAGVILGTASYMSPEQARGKNVDRRSDVWSFGALLFELLARKQCFAGETISDTLAAVIKDEPEWEQLPHETPPAIADLLKRCLEKDPRRRLQSIGEARIVIENTQHPHGVPSVTSGRTAPSTAGGAAMGSPSRVHGRGTRGTGAWLAALAGTALAAGLAGWYLSPGAPEPRTRNHAFTAQGLQVEFPLPPVISPDGSHIAFMANNRLWIRDLDVLDAVEIVGADGAQAPFWSPDGAWLAFGVGGRLLKVPATGGNSVAICDMPFNSLDGGAWSPDGTIYLAPNSGAIHAVSALGGDPRPFIVPVPDHESDFHTPSALPGGQGLLFTTHRTEGRDTIEVQANGQRKVILRIEGARLEYAMFSPSGHIVFHRQETNAGVWAAPFSLDRLELTGEPFILHPDGAFPSVARDGTLLYALGAGTGLRQIVQVSRSGEVLGNIGQPQPGMEYPELSPDGRSVLVSAREGDNRDVWLHDVERGTRTRMTFGTDPDWAAMWMPDGTRIAFNNGSAASNKTWVRSAFGSGEPELLLEGYLPSIRSGVPWVIYTVFGAGTADDLLYRSLDGGGEIQVFLRSEATENGAQLSPDGHYVLYDADESGDYEVYLKTFPGGEGKWQVSTRGGTWPRWSRKGDEIFYVVGFGQLGGLMSVKVITKEPLRMGTPERLFGTSESPNLAYRGGQRGYDVMPDGKSFIMLQSIDAGRDSTRLVLSENWYEAYRKRKG